MLIYIPVDNQVKAINKSICFIIVFYILWGILKQFNISLFGRLNLSQEVKCGLCYLGWKNPSSFGSFLHLKESAYRACTVRHLPTQLLCGFLTNRRVHWPLFRLLGCCLSEMLLSRKISLPSELFLFYPKLLTKRLLYCPPRYTLNPTYIGSINCISDTQGMWEPEGGLSVEDGLLASIVLFPLWGRGNFPLLSLLVLLVYQSN